MAEEENIIEEENTIEEELDDLMDDIEIEDEIHQEEKVRKKNAKILLISIIGLLTIAGVYFGVNYYNVLEEEEQLIEKAELPLNDESDKATLPIPEGVEKTEGREGLLPQEAVKNKEEGKTQPQKQDIEKKEIANLKDQKKKTEVKETVPPKKETEKIEKVARAEEQNKTEGSKSAQLLKDLKKPTVEKELKTPPPPTKKEVKTLIPETEKMGKYYIQFGLFVIKKNADNLIRSLKDKGFSPSNILVKNIKDMYRVYAGEFSELKKARVAIIDLENTGINATLKTVTNGLYTLQTGSFYIKENAEKLKEEIAELGFISKIVRVPILMDVYKVYIGYFKTKKDASSYQQKLAVQGFSETLILSS